MNRDSIFTSLLTVAFIVLKLTNQVDWSWWWVLSPIWIVFCLGLAAFLIGLFVKTPEKKKTKNKYSTFHQRLAEIERQKQQKQNP